MSEARLPTDIWVMAQVRRCHAEGRPAFVLRKGERTGGLVLLKVNRLDGTALVLTQQRDLDGRLGWMVAAGKGPVPEAEADAYLERATRRDPDLWLVEVEDPKGEPPFEGPLITLG
ncbi:hypothetical protein SAMN06265365_12157 [Tistlia consotensis]|uniref:DUF1491 domain-containing protein n=1 Tax=Tistlia consotensis USBA 355 TaxID=560819 RepID=A0A1Y6CMU3_9PROT|nr:DUF1491 family protein [Tistlia consotensis]SMF60613.1 hypothetical protein SAMN05428998_12366 [Tistlia consotensis USBA 355]SNR93153.1 hypothetical protein SAMN06265365_12157 [Tistlia consotensis]